MKFYHLLFCVGMCVPKISLIVIDDKDRHDTDVPGESSCVWSVDCYDKTKRRLCSGPWNDAPCKCVFGKCRFTTDIAFRDRCTTYKDCDCKHNRDTCFCVAGTCNLRGPWECHQHPGRKYSEDCRKIKKCHGRRCYCNDGACEKLEDESIDVCDEPKGQNGDCKAFFKKWTFDKISRKCEEFIYGGCGGNSNNFDTKAECEKRCDALSDQDLWNKRCRGCAKKAEVRQDIVDFAVQELEGGSDELCKRKVIKVENFTSKPVAGSLYEFDLVMVHCESTTSSNPEKCHMVVYDVPWMKQRTVEWDRVNCEGSPKIVIDD